jgi:hypothetical protein
MKSSKGLFVFQIITNYFIFTELRVILNDLNVMLLNKQAINVVLTEMSFKRLAIKHLLDKNVILSEVIFLLQNFIDLNVYFINNTIG